MSYIEDEYKKRFTDQEINNDDLNSDDLWDNISDEIGPDESKRNRKFIPCLKYIWVPLLQKKSCPCFSQSSGLFFHHSFIHFHRPFLTMRLPVIYISI